MKKNLIILVLSVLLIQPSFSDEEQEKDLSCEESYEKLSNDMKDLVTNPMNNQVTVWNSSIGGSDQLYPSLITNAFSGSAPSGYANATAGIQSSLTDGYYFNSQNALKFINCMKN